MIRHHVFAALWELAATVLCTPSLAMKGEKHRRALMASREIPLCSYRFPSEEEANARARQSLEETRECREWNAKQSLPHMRKRRVA